MSKVVDELQSAASSLGNGLEKLAGEISNGIQFVWKEVAMPVMEEVFSWIGIVDEYVIQAVRISSKLMDNGSDHYRTAVIRTVMQNIRNNATFYQNYVYEVTRVKSQIRTQYRMVERGRYLHELPVLTVSAGNVDQDAIKVALDAAVGGSNTIIDSNSHSPTDLNYFQNELQQAPELYKPYDNTLTYANQYGQVFSDWELFSVDFNDTNTNYDITIRRPAELTHFWIEGQDQVVEGDSVTYTVKCSRPIPAGETITATLSYSGTAVDGVDYTSITSLDILEGTQETVLVLPTIENAASEANRTIVVTLASVDNSAAVFELIRIPEQDETVTTIITDDDSLILTMSNVKVPESAGSVTVPVKLEGAASAFTVDFVLTNITAIKGTDYENLTGTLSFSGTVGEIVNIVIGITADVVDDDYEQFQVSLTNCSDPSIDISQVSVVTIVDGTDVSYTPGVTMDTLVFSRPDYESSKTLIVKYHPDAGIPSEWSYWMYRYVDGTYPAVEETADRISGLELLPMIPIRTDKVNISKDNDIADYKSTKRILDIMGLNVDDLVESLASNPSIDDVDDAIINFGICPSDDSPALSKMMYLMWNDIIHTYGINSTVNKYHASYTVGDVIGNSVAWTDQTRTEGVPTPLVHEVGSYRHEIDGEDLVLYYQTAPNAATVIRASNVKSLSSINAIIGGQEYHKMSVSSVELPDFTIPVSWYMFNKLSYKEVLQAFPLITRLDCYAAIETEIAWYATDDFKIFLRIVQIVLVVYFWWTGAGTWTELAFEVITQLAIAELVMLGIEVILEITGNADLALAVGLIAAVLVSGNGSFSIDFTSAEQLISLSTNFANNIGKVQELLQEDFIAKRDETNKKLDEREKELYDAQSEVNTAITGEYMVQLNSLDSNIAQAITLQYSYDYMYNYDNLTTNYFTNKLRVGVL